MSRRAPGAGSRGEDSVALATLARRLAVLLGAGVAPATAWTHAGTGTPLAEWATRIARGEPGGIADRIAGGSAGALSEERAALAAIWSVSVAAGAPLAVALRAYAELLRGFAETERQRRVALSGPTATARLVMAMPVLGLVLGTALGQDTVGVLLGTPIGWGCLLSGAGLMGAAWAWNRALLRRAAATPRLPGLAAELVAVAMQGGFAAGRARDLVASVLARRGIAADLATVDAAMRVATAAGAPVAELLRAEAEEARRIALGAAAERAERLSVLLMMPLGLCVLPAFLALGVVPMIVGLLASTISAI